MPYLTTFLFVLAITLNIFLIIRLRREDGKRIKREQPKKKGRKRYLPLILVNLTLVITITITVKIEFSKDRSNNQNNNVPVPSPSASADDNQESAKLKEKLRTSYEGDGFSIKPLLESELIKGRQCCYYELIVKGPALFPMGEYIIKDQDKEYSQPLTNFFDEVIAVLRRAHIEHQLFIKGSADKTGDKTFSKDFVIERYTYREIAYLPYDPKQQQFTPNFQSWEIPGAYANRDLPNLRARYTQDTLKNSPRQLDSIILAGVVTPKLDEPKDRNIMILLYIQWSS